MAASLAASTTTLTSAAAAAIGAQPRPSLSTAAPQLPARRIARSTCVACSATRQNETSGPASAVGEALTAGAATLGRAAVTAALAGALIAAPAVMLPPAATNNAAFAELNRFEADTRGEFGIGSAAQYGSADLRATVHKDENFRRANFTSADMREADFSGSVFIGGYLEKAVAYRTNFEGADFTDALMDRMVLNEANLRNAVLVRTVLTRSDLKDANIEGADFSDAVIDLPQKQALCKTAKGENPSTGMSTRESLGCGNRRGNAYGTPSAPILSAAPQKFLDKDGFCDQASGLCDATR